MNKINAVSRPGLGLRGISCALALLVSPISFADYEDGVNAAFEGDFDTAFQEFSIAADAGLDLAQYNLAILYFTGQGVARDLGQAFRWTEAAALQGHVAAQFNLANLYYSGDGVAVDKAKAVTMFENAAEGGHPAAALVLANMYADGEIGGDEEPGLLARISEYFFGGLGDGDLVRAHVWANIALDNESDQADALRADLESRMTARQLSEARRQFALWKLE